MKKRPMSVDFANNANNLSLLDDLRDLLETLDTFLSLECRILSGMGDDSPRRARMIQFIGQLESLRSSLAVHAGRHKAGGLFRQLIGTPLP